MAKNCDVYFAAFFGVLSLHIFFKLTMETETPDISALILAILVGSFAFFANKIYNSFE